MTGNNTEEAFAASPTESTASDLSSPQSTASYFPSSHRSSVSSISSSAAIATETEPVVIKLAQPPKGKQTTAVPATTSSSTVPAPPSPSVPVTSRHVRQDAMTKSFPKPTRELSVEEMLARPAQKHSLSHYLKNARDCRVPVVDKAKSAKDFADAKRDLLRAKEELQRLSIGGAGSQR
ncbi:hypothetical protein B0T19DRAFT_440196 [Cercophora scortea]|uniref:Uncharacterized protein n=1 Tax=Cercophora scortea TaxID=314031 RepID=A0AAE0IYJ6_9PEZI|nr:hypothetical protein B0T19DRAFT_440196 [Cercophora scortea]